MNVKGIIFDLDDTLFDCTGTLAESARKRAAKAMVKAGLKCRWEEAYKKINEFKKKKGPKTDAFQKVVEFFGPKEHSIVKEAIKSYNSEEGIEGIELFPGVKETLASLREEYKLILVTSGTRVRQQKKIELLGLNHDFDLIIIDDLEEQLSKEDRFLAVLKNFKLVPEEVLVVGDRIFSEIKVGNILGMTTVQMLHGAYSGLVPKRGIETPDFRITRIPELIRILEELENHKELKIVVIGGGTGLPSMLKGLKKYTRELTAVVGVTDSGRSSGMLRKDFDMAPPGDIRNCLVALSDAEKLMGDLFHHRFMNGSLEGHSFGNLLITALTQTTGSFEKAIHEVGGILKIKGKVLPSSHENVHICAEFSDGKVIKEEDNIIDRHNPNVHLRPRIKRVFLNKPVSACGSAVDAILEADVVVIGPGSLFTSVITNLLVKGIRDAIVKSKAKKVYVCNIMSQPSQTYGFKASEHVAEVVKYLGDDVLDYIILNNEKPPKKLLKLYEKDHSPMVVVDRKGLKKFKGKKIEADIVEDMKEIKVLWNKKNLLRHDSDKIAKIIVDLV